MLTATTTRLQRTLLWLAPAVTTAGMLGFAFAAASDPRAPGVFWVLGPIAVGIAWWSYVSIPRRLAIDGGALVVERPIGRLSVPIAKIRRVDARVWNRGFVTVATESGKIYLLRGTENLSVVVAEIVRQNPGATVVGNVPHVA